MNVIGHHVKAKNQPLSISAHNLGHFYQALTNLARQHSTTVLRRKHHMVIQIVVGVPCYTLKRHVHTIAQPAKLVTAQ